MPPLLFLNLDFEILSLSKNLYELIHSLNKNEKGYFVKFVQSQGKGSDYLQFFHALYQLPEYNQETLFREHAGAGFLKNLAYSQNYLYSMILKSLRLYYEKQQIDIELYAMLSEVSVLEAKGLKKQSAGLLKRVKKKALKYHHFSIVIEVLKKQAIQVVATKGQNLLKDTLDIYQEIFDTLKIIDEEITYRQLNHSILLYYRHGAGAAPQSFSDVLKSVSDHPFVREDVFPQSFYAQYLKFNIRATEARIYGDREIAYVNYEKILDIWEAHPEILKANTNFYKINISNFLGNAILINQVDKIEKYLKIMETLATRNQKEKRETFQNIIFFKLLFYLNQSKLEEGAIYLNSIEAELKKHAENLNHARVIAIYYNALILNILLENFEASQNWVNLILNERNKTIRSDAKFFARIMQLIIHFELNNDQLLDYLHSSIKRQLVGGSQENGYEKLILSHFKKLMTAVSKREKTQAFINFKSELLPFKAMEPEPTSINEIFIWLDARINNKSLQEIYRENISTKK